VSSPAPTWTAASWSALARVELVVLDVDGVLTDGRIVYGVNGPHDELMHFHVHDGLAQRWLEKEGIRQVWITGRGCAATRARAKELHADELVERSPHKGESLRAIQARLGIPRERTLAMGDDLPDLALRGDCALFVAPANACEAVKERADHVTRASGGRGAVRELVEDLLRARDRWNALVDAALR